jgi:hypothetical protein
MTIYCPRCGKAGCDETVVSFVSVWASCTNCQLVWRSSLLETVVGYAARGVGLSRNQKVVDRDNTQNPPADPELQQPSGSLKPVSVDRVAEWLATQEHVTGAPCRSLVAHSAADADMVEEMFDQLDPAGPVKTPGVTAQKEADDFYAFFAEEDLQLPVAAAVHAEPIEQPPVAQVVSPVEVTPCIHEAEVVQHVDEMADVRHMDDGDGITLETSSDRALSNVEELYEAFKRLEQQLGTITDSLQTYNPHP